MNVNKGSHCGTKHSPFTWDVKVHKFTSVVLHVYRLYRWSPTNLKESEPKDDVRKDVTWVLSANVS